MAKDPHIGQMYIKLDGQNASADIMNSLIAVEVDFSMQLPAMFTITMFNPGGRWLDDDTFAEGKKVEISSEGEGGPVLLCVGKISAYEPDLTGGRQQLTIRGYDLSYGLYRNKHSRTYVQMTDSDIAGKITRESGLKAAIEDSKQVHEYVLQNNQTHMEFLRERSKALGFELFVRGDELIFRPPPSASNGNSISLEFGTDFEHFQPRLSVCDQVDEVTVSGWDEHNKKEIRGRATRGSGAPKIGEKRTGGSVAGGIWGEANLHVTDQPVANQAEADKLAQAILDEKTSGFITGEGSCRGNPAILVGTSIEIKGVSDRFKGKYYVTACNHRLSQDEGYVTHFSLSSKSSGSMLEALRGPQQSKRNFGLCAGIVTNNKDPEGFGRVRVKFPWLKDGLESNWARIATLLAGGGRGTYCLPEVNDEVLVGFEQGDINRPFVLGCLWNGSDKPPASNDDMISSDGKVQKFILRTRSGHTIEIDDTDSSPGISIRDKTDKNLIAIDSDSNAIQIESAGNITIESKGKVTIKGREGVDIDATPGAVGVRGTTINLN